MLRAAVAGGLLAVLMLPLQAQAVEVGLTVPTVTVPLPVPTVPTVTTPSVPTAPVEAPPAPTPKLPVTTPTVTTPTVTTPTVTVPTVKAPSPPPPVNSVSVPSVSVPSVSVPSVSVGTPPPPSVKAPAGLPSGPLAPGAAQGGSTTGSAGSQARLAAGAAAVSGASAVPAYAARALTLPVFAHGLAARQRTRALIAMIRRYAACLADLPTPIGTLLALRAGLTSGHAQSPARTAARLHLSRARYARLEKQAVSRLLAEVQNGCAASSPLATTAAGGFGPWSGTGGLAAAGGVLDARYEKPAPAALGPSGPGASSSLFGLSLSPAARDSLLAAFLAFGGGALVFAFLFLDGLGIGPRHPRWRRQFRRRFSLRGPGGRPPGALRRRV
jgi:hypothetical protein